ncbi:MAG: DUF2892 domain-containing protein [Deltaproteobacteria bacterium]|nr:MAG: DUF2892 domain-containing protein [Deltaproteobacteria bacterium]
MGCNVGKADRIIRIVVGVGLIGFGLATKSWLGAIGIIPLATAAIGFCPLYTPLKINTCSQK